MRLGQYEILLLDGDGKETSPECEFNAINANGNGERGEYSIRALVYRDSNGHYPHDCMVAGLHVGGECVGYGGLLNLTTDGDSVSVTFRGRRAAGKLHPFQFGSQSQSQSHSQSQSQSQEGEGLRMSFFALGDENKSGNGHAKGNGYTNGHAKTPPQPQS
jgi:hypothetical protein